MGDWQDDLPSDKWIAGKAVRWTVILIVCVIIGVTMLLAMRPAWLRMERDATKASHQYVEGKETMLLTWLDEYREVEVQIATAEAAEEPNEALIASLEMQRDTMGDRIEREAQRVDQDALPESVRDFLAER